MKIFNIYNLLLLSVNVLLVKSAVTFKVIAVDGTPSVLINDKKYEMTLLDYPVYTASVDVVPPLEYSYILNDKQEDIIREIKENETETLNEFYGRSVTVKEHPQLPAAYQVYPGLVKSKLFDDTNVSTILIEGNQDDIDNIHKNPKNSDLKITGMKVTYVDPYTIMKFNNAKLSISGQSSLKFKKLSYKIGSLKTDDKKELFNRSGIKLRATYKDYSFLREKTYIDILNTLGVPTSQAKYTRLFINKVEVGLFLITDDIDNKKFLRETMNNGNKYEQDNAIFKASCASTMYGDLGYYGQESNLYDSYSYKGDLDEFDNEEMFKTHLLPFLEKADGYPYKVDTLNFDIESFVKAMAAEFALGAADNFWLYPGNYFIFRDVAKDFYHFIDADLDNTFGIGAKYKCMLDATVENFAQCNTIITTERKFLDRIFKKDANRKLLDKVLAQLFKTSFNVKSIGPRIASFGVLIREDVEWDFSLPKLNLDTSQELDEVHHTLEKFDAAINNDELDDLAFPIKYWIIERTKRLGVTVPEVLDTSNGYYENPANVKCTQGFGKCNVIAKKTTPPPSSSTTTTTTTTSSEQTYPVSTNDRCGKDFKTRCPENECCSKHGWCGTSDEHCGIECQSEFGRCSSKTTTTTKKTITTTTTTIKTTTTASEQTYPVSTDDRCGKDFKTRCPNNECCSKHGWCGTSDEYCGKECQSEFGRCKATDYPISTNDRCGKDFKTRCPNSECCSEHGWCGTSKDHCGTGCQSGFGKCNINSTTTTKKKTTTTKKKTTTTKKKTTTTKKKTTTTKKKTTTTTKAKATKIAVGGLCGWQNKAYCPHDRCCSKYGYCGTSSDYCGSGCQAGYGRCN